MHRQVNGLGAEIGGAAKHGVEVIGRLRLATAAEEIVEGSGVDGVAASEGIGSSSGSGT